LLIQSSERRLSGKQLVAYDAEGVDIRARIDQGICRGLFGRHIRRGAERNSE
jgi:hypothetical protein